MISLYKIKPAFQRLLLPILRVLHGMGVTPNAITLLAILISIGTGLFTWFNPGAAALLLLPAVLLLRMALNALDGMMARTYGLQSKSGEVMNELGDVVSDLALFFPLWKLFQVDLYPLLFFLFLSVINEFSGLLGKVISGVRRYEGPMGKSDRAFVIGTVSLVLFFSPGAAQHMNLLFLLLCVLLVVSTAVRLHKTLTN